MRFNCRPDSLVELEMQKILQRLYITIPIVHIKNTLYLVGLTRIHIELKAGHVIANIGGGYERFEEYITYHHKSI